METVHAHPSSPPADRPLAAPTRGLPADDAGPRYPGAVALFLIWTAVGVVTSARHYFGPSSMHLRTELAVFFACVAYFYPWVAASPLAFRLERRFPLGGAGWVRNLGALAACSLPICLVVAPAMLGVTLLVHVAFGDPMWMPSVVFFFIGLLPAALASFWSSVAGGYVVRTRFELQAQERRSARLAVEKSELAAGLNQAQLEVLRARLNPHFLFNSLQNISVMIGQDPKTASGMVTRLGDLLRAVLRQDSRPETTLQEEVALARTYVAIEQMRFGDRLQVGFDIAPSAQNAMVPSFLLQPLIENAIVHGLRGVRKTGVITVAGFTDAEDLVLTVTDNGIGPPPQEGPELKVGVGLGSTCERLARMYPDRHSFSMQRPPAGGAEVRITLPLRPATAAGQPHDDEQPAFADR
jgi:two-component system, LytTR family, sensor kinase